MATIAEQDQVTTTALTESPCKPSSLQWLLAQCSHVLNTEMTAAMEDLGLSPRGHCVLTVAEAGTFTQKEIAQAIGLDKTTMVVTLDQLERDGLAERTPSPTDRRARVISLTDAGREMVGRGREIQAAVERGVLDSLPADQRDAMLGALSTLATDRLSTPAACSAAPRRRRT